MVTAETRADLFRIGKLLRLSPSNESLSGEPEIVRARLNRMRVAVSRLLKRSELLISNVEVGIFPSYKAVELSTPRFNARQLEQHKELESKWWELTLISALSVTLPLFRVVLSPTVTRPFCAVPRTSVARTASG